MKVEYNKTQAAKMFVRLSESGAFAGLGAPCSEALRLHRQVGSQDQLRPNRCVELTDGTYKCKDVVFTVSSIEPVAAKLGLWNEKRLSGGERTVAVVGEQAPNGDAQVGVVGHSCTEEGDGGGRSEGGQDLAEGDVGMIVKGDVKVFPAAVMLATTTAIGTEGDVGEAAQLLDIEMQQIPRGSMLITNDGDSRLQIADAVQAQAAKDATDGGTAQTRAWAICRPEKRCKAA